MDSWKKMKVKLDFMSIVNRVISFLFVASLSTASIATESDSLLKNQQKLDFVKVIPSSENDFKSHEYYTKLLLLALAKTADEYGETEIVQTKEMMVQERNFIELEHGKIDVYWSVTSNSRESTSIPIRIPLLNGVMGYRVSLILKDQLDYFSQQSIEQFTKKTVAGQGHDWPDYEILKSNNLLVLGTSNYDALIELLKRKRIDHFPRAINETLVEIETLNDPELSVEPNILLYYPSYMFFFVSSSKPNLAKRIEKGLNLAIAEGSFQCQFEKYIDIERISKKLGLKERKLVILDNPLLSEESGKLNLPRVWQFKSKPHC